MIHPELWLWFTFSALCLWASVASRPESKFRIGGEGGETPPQLGTPTRGASPISEWGREVLRPQSRTPSRVHVPMFVFVVLFFWGDQTPPRFPRRIVLRVLALACVCACSSICESMRAPGDPVADTTHDDVTSVSVVKFLESRIGSRFSMPPWPLG